MRVLIVVGMLVVQSIYAGSVLRTDNGRYVFGQVNDFATSQYLLDTETGRLWGKNIDPDTKLQFLKPLVYQFEEDGHRVMPGDKVTKDVLATWDALIQFEGVVERDLNKGNVGCIDIAPRNDREWQNNRSFRIRRNA